MTEEEAHHSVFYRAPPYSKRPKITVLSAHFLLLWCHRGFSQELAELVPQTRSSVMLVKQEGGEKNAFSVILHKVEAAMLL